MKYKFSGVRLSLNCGQQRVCYSPQDSVTDASLALICAQKKSIFKECHQVAV
jgi:hypothetical protein